MPVSIYSRTMSKAAQPDPDQDPDRRETGPRPEPEIDQRTGRSAAYLRIQHQQHWVDLQVQQAAERGEFDDLPGYGKPIESLGQDHDPDWWIKQLIEREQITGVLPLALQLRKDDLELDGLLDRQSAEKEVRRLVEEFNERIRQAWYATPGGPPVVTQQRDLDTELDRWRQRRQERIAAQQRAIAEQRDAESRSPRRRWFRRR